MKDRGFTLVETLVALGIVLLIASIGISAFYSGRKPREISATADGIVEVLERAKADALAGKNGQSYGVYFSSTTYAYFAGTSYATTSATNLTNKVFSDLRLSDTISGNAVVFAHLTGTPTATGTITVADYTGSTTSKIVSVGSAGDIDVLQ